MLKKIPLNLMGPILASGKEPKQKNRWFSGWFFDFQRTMVIMPGGLHLLECFRTRKWVGIYTRDANWWAFVPISKNRPRAG